MKLKKTIALLAFSCMLTATAQTVAHDDPVAAEVLSINNKVIKKLNVQRKKNGTLSTEDVLAIIRADVSPKFNFEQLTKRAMGKHWKRADSDMQKKLTDAFRSLMEKTYAKVLEKYNDEKVTLVEARMLQSDSGVSVLMEIFSSGKPVQIDYIMSPDAVGEHRIVDIKVEKVSLLANYRRQFAQIIRKSKVEGLLTELQKQAAAK